METNKGMQTLYAKTKQEWRMWLEKNSESRKDICLIMYHKKSDKQSISHDEAVDEALCFGWIDSVRNSRDHESFYQRFSPRRPNSNWSNRNKEKFERLTEKGLMTERGRQAAEKGRW